MPIVPNKQDNLNVKFECGGYSDWVVHNAIVKDHISNPFEAEISLYNTKLIIPEKLLNESGKLFISFGSDNSTTEFNGIISKCSVKFTKNVRENQELIHVILVPEFWRLSLSKRYRVFNKKSANDIIDTILKENSISSVKKNLSFSGKKTRDYCVQYDESDLYFLSRLMEEEGSFYFFENFKNKTNIVISDKSSSAKTNSTVFNLLSSYSHALQLTDKVYNCSFEGQLGIKKVISGAFNHKKFQTVRGQAENTRMSSNIGIIENYISYFEEISDGEALSKVILESENCLSTMLKCSSQNPSVSAGSIIKIKDDSFESLNQSFFVTEIIHEVKQIEEENWVFYENQIRAIPSSVPYRSPLCHPKKRVTGVHPGTVVGTDSEEIDVDELGSVKVVPYYPNIEKEKNSVIARVAQFWAGKKRGAIVNPRIGDEVTLSYYNGDPDHPVVKGSLYNGVNKPPANYPKSRKTALSIFTLSSKNGDENSHNEIRLDDAKDNEEVFIHAQKNQVVVVEDSYTETINHGNRSVTLESIKDEGEAKVTNSLKIKNGDNITTINKGDYSVVLDEGNESILLKKGNMSISLSEGNLTIDVKGDISISAENINIKANKDVSWNVVGNYKKEVTKDLTVSSQNIKCSVKQNYELSATKMTVNTTTDISIKASTNVSIEGSVGLKIKGGTTANIESGVSMIVKGGVSGTFEGGTSATLKGGAAASVIAAMVSLN